MYKNNQISQQIITLKQTKIVLSALHFDNDIHRNKNALMITYQGIYC